MRVYLDNCCFNRPFDDQSSLKIRLETEAKFHVQSLIVDGNLELVWSYILDYENAQNPFFERKSAIIDWKSRSVADIIATKEIIDSGNRLVELGLKPKDALHVACAQYGKCEIFLTTDSGILKRRSEVTELKVSNPIDFIIDLEASDK